MEGNLAAVIPAAGLGRRLKARNPKAFLPVFGNPLFILTLKNLASACRIGRIVVAVPAGYESRAQKILKRHGFKQAQAIRGGNTRSESVKRALDALPASVEWVLVHDAARPFVSKKLIRRLLAAARRHGGAIAALPATSTVKRVEGSRLVSTEDRRVLVLAQTPQVFRAKLLRERYNRLGRKAFGATDEAALFDGTKTKVRWVQGEAQNVKITTPDDLKLLRVCYANRYRL